MLDMKIIKEEFLLIIKIFKCLSKYSYFSSKIWKEGGFNHIIKILSDDLINEY